MSHSCDIIIPTYNLPEYLSQCVNSIIAHTTLFSEMKIIIVNNGEKESVDLTLTKHPSITVLQADKNLGWEGGLKLGLEHSKAPFVCFMNDDTYIPYASHYWALRCLSEFADQSVAAVGPTSNVVSGAQNIFMDQFGGPKTFFAPWLIGFCVFMRRSDLDAIGGVDDQLPGGDDFDYSIRFKKAGKKMVVCRDVFVYHHGFKTGERLKGGSNRPGGWNSKDMIERTNSALIRKHGFKIWINAHYGGCEPSETKSVSYEEEKSVIAKKIKPGVIYDIGCGPDKTVPGAVGIDRVLKNDVIPHLEGKVSNADIQADATKEIPVPDSSADTIIVRHLLEHCVDTIETLKGWIKKLKPDGRLIIAVPDERFFSSIPMNIEHRHAFTPESLQNLMKLLKMEQVDFAEKYNNVSFTSVFQKNGVDHA